MAAAKLEAYYWETYALIFENTDTLRVALEDEGFALSDSDTANIEQSIHAVLPFRDRSRLHAEIQLAADGETFEERYAYIYIYYDARDQRILQYDNRDYHPEISTYPHHMHKGAISNAGEKDSAWPTFHEADQQFFRNTILLRRIRQGNIFLQRQRFLAGTCHGFLNFLQQSDRARSSLWHGAEKLELLQEEQVLRTTALRGDLDLEFDEEANVHLRKSEQSKMRGGKDDRRSI